MGISETEVPKGGRLAGGKFYGEEKGNEAKEGVGGADGDRTHDLLNAIQALSQLSYGPNAGRGIYRHP